MHPDMDKIKKRLEYIEDLMSHKLKSSPHNDTASYIRHTVGWMLAIIVDLDNKSPSQTITQLTDELETKALMMFWKD